MSLGIVQSRKEWKLRVELLPAVVVWGCHLNISQVLWEYPAGRRLQGRTLQTLWMNYIVFLVWESLEIFNEAVEEVT